MTPNQTRTITASFVFAMCALSGCVSEVGTDEARISRAEAFAYLGTRPRYSERPPLFWRDDPLIESRYRATRPRIDELHVDAASTNGNRRSVAVSIPDDTECAIITDCDFRFADSTPKPNLRYLHIEAKGATASALIEYLRETGTFPSLSGLKLGISLSGMSAFDLSFATNLTSLVSLEIEINSDRQCRYTNVECLRNISSLRTLMLTSGVNVTQLGVGRSRSSNPAVIESFGENKWENVETLDLAGCVLMRQDTLCSFPKLKRFAPPLFCGLNSIPKGVETLDLYRSDIRSIADIVLVPDVKKIAFGNHITAIDYLKEVQSTKGDAVKKIDEWKWSIKDEAGKEHVYDICM